VTDVVRSTVEGVATTVPGIGGVGALIVTLPVAVADFPLPSSTVTLTLNVPAELKAWSGAARLSSAVPSPKFHV
jgi:hypothetical protein